MCMLFAHFKLECVRSQFFSDERGGVLSSQATELTANSDTLNRLKNLLSLNKKIIKRRTLYYFISVYIIFPIILNYYCCIRLLIYLFYFGGWVYRICWCRRRMLLQYCKRSGRITIRAQLGDKICDICRLLFSLLWLVLMILVRCICSLCKLHLNVA